MTRFSSAPVGDALELVLTIDRSRHHGRPGDPLGGRFAGVPGR